MGERGKGRSVGEKKGGSGRRSSGCFGNVVLSVKQRPLRVGRSRKRVLMVHLGRQVVSTENEDYALAKVEGLLQVGTSVGLHSETFAFAPGIAPSANLLICFFRRNLQDSKVTGICWLYYDCVPEHHKMVNSEMFF